MVHPLRIAAIGSLGGLMLVQLIPAFAADDRAWYWVCLFMAPLLIPLRGMLADHAYTYRWTGFLALLYFCIGISELVSSPDQRIYAYLTTLCSVLLFLSVIYYARYRRLS